MCGRYLIDEEAYSDILEILYRLGAVPPTSAGGAITGAIKDAVAATLPDMVPETVPDAMHDLFPGTPPIVTDGEVFPTNIAPVLTSDGPAAIKWGFPHPRGSAVIINARAETALEKQIFRKSLLERRCVILSNGFYEWGDGMDSLGKMQIGLLGTGESFTGRHGGRRKKTKYLLRHPDESKLYMAGFWSAFRDASGAPYNAFVILTTAANGSVCAIHGRMPLILSPLERDDWLGDISFVEHALLRPGPELEAVPC